MYVTENDLVRRVQATGSCWAIRTLSIMKQALDTLNGAKNPTVPAASAQMGGIGAESSKYEADFNTVPSLMVEIEHKNSLG